MSRATMAAASAAVPRPDLYGIGSCKVGTEIHEFEIGWDEAERDNAWALDVLRTTGLSSDDLALLTLPNWEGPWFSPLVAGLRSLKVTLALAENYGWDARRAAHMIRNLKPRAYVGLCAETLQGFGGHGDDVAELLADIEFVWARHDALTPLSTLGVEALPLVPLGPALAIGLPGVGAVVNSAEWSVATLDGQFVVSTAADRRTRFVDVETGICGRVGASVVQGTLVEFDL
ncbi:hypothetical protein [Mycobacterium sp. 050134]|uniref:hypothetical protein n=1 Tax=Mycobacterium sp. 050134 TaxID=3096111 RepID=UPI002ED7EDC6